MVKLLKQVSHAEVFGCWLRKEYDGRKSFKRHVNTTIPLKYRKFIHRQNLRNEFENEIRYAILISYRKFAANYRCANWWEVELEEKDLKNLLVIHSPHWMKLSGGTLRALDIAKRVNKFKTIPIALRQTKE